jgi:hypothetical protein
MGIGRNCDYYLHRKPRIEGSETFWPILCSVPFDVSGGRERELSPGARRINLKVKFTRPIGEICGSYVQRTRASSSSLGSAFLPVRLRESRVGANGGVFKQLELDGDSSRWGSSGSRLLCERLNARAMNYRRLVIKDNAGINEGICKILLGSVCGKLTQRFSVP